MDSFWRSWRAKFCSSARSSVIDGCSDESSIGNQFASLFKSTCVPNSQLRHESSKAKFHCEFDKYLGNAQLLQCDVELVDDCIKDLNRGKAAGHDEHLLHAHPILVVLLSLLFNMLAVHGMVPCDFGKGIIITLLIVTKPVVTTTGALQLTLWLAKSLN